jgi:hypothetical protein
MLSWFLARRMATKMASHPHHAAPHHPPLHIHIPPATEAGKGLTRNITVHVEYRKHRFLGLF